MAGFEVVVRPVVFPDIRPAPAQPVPPADDPEKGFATIRGNGGHQFTTSSSYSSSSSSSQRSEFKRREDEVRVYQQKDDGTINKKNFVDIRVANKVWMKGPPSFSVSTPEVAKNEVAGFDVGGVIEKGVYYYKRIKEGGNIEIRKKNLITGKDQSVSGGG